MEQLKTTYQKALENQLPLVIYHKEKDMIQLNENFRSLFSNGAELPNDTELVQSDFEQIEAELLTLFNENTTAKQWQYAIIREKELLYMGSAPFNINAVEGFVFYLFLDVKDAKDALSQTDMVKEIQEFHYAVLNAIDDGVFITDGEGTVISVNDRALFGRAPSSMIGFNMKDLEERGICPESVSLEAIKLGKKITRYQYRHEEREILTTATPYFKDGNITMVVCCQRLVSELELLKKQLQETEEINSQYEGELTYLRSLNAKGNDIVAESKAIKKVLEMALIAAKYDSPVLIEGESGVGKEVIADYIYTNSHRFNKPFIKINCNAIPESLFESEFFGYEKGSFSGANLSGHKGYFELANNGTLLLDEIGDIPLAMQAKLLRAIERKEILKIGGYKTISLDVQIIAATNKDLAEAVKEGTFRSDLYYRLNSFPIIVPPLRERREDIIPLVRFFTQINNRKYGLNKTFTDGALLHLERHDWIGNVRELENVVRRILITTKSDTIDIIHILSVIIDDKILPEMEDSDPLTFDHVMEDFEKILLINYIKKYPNISELEKILGISRSTLNRKLIKYDLRQYLNQAE